MSPEDARRQQLLDATERVLQRQGAARTTIVEIAREADLSVGAVYLYFHSKDAILEALARKRYDTVLGAMNRAAADASLGYADRLRATFDAKVRCLLSLADEGTYAVEIVHCMKGCVQSAHERFRSAELMVIADLLAQGRRDHSFEFTDDPHSLAETLLNAYTAFSPPWVFHAPRETLSRRLDAMHRLTLHGLIARPPLTNR